MVSKREASIAARQIAKALLHNMSDRSGFHLDAVDEDIVQEWEQEWRNIVEGVLLCELKVCMGYGGIRDRKTKKRI